MVDELLIELVRENRPLYDSSHAKYMDPNYKTNLWNEIGEQLNLDGTTCKARWNNIRDNYRKSLKRTHTSSGQKRANVKLYKYHDQVNFMKNYFTGRKRKESVEQQEEYLELQEVEDEEVNPISITPTHDESMPTSYAPSPSPSHESTPSSSQKKKGAKNAASSLMEHVLQQIQASAEHTQHPVDAFLNSIAPTLKGLNQYYLNLAKSEIFATTQKYEMKMITEQNVTPGVDTKNV